MRIVTIVGARPQFVKLAPVSRAMSDHAVTRGVTVEDIIVHTGQHYDTGMSDVFFDELEIPKPAIHLGVGSGSHGLQTARMIESIETTLVDQRPDKVVIYGDTNSTLAGAVAASKMHIPIAHVEAGLRSFDRRMPEEVNRLVADHLSDALFAPTQTAMTNLQNENLVARAFKTGDVMLDAVMFNRALADERSNILSELEVEEGSYGVVTMHRPANTDYECLIALLDCFNDLAREELRIIFPMHPRTRAAIRENASAWKPVKELTVIEPLGYLDMLKLLGHARIAVTDSGGMQKEALFLGTYCVTLREETEWPETVDAGCNILVGADPKRIRTAVGKTLSRSEGHFRATVNPFGEGDAAVAIVRNLVN